jgi:hypothetical protein
LCAQADVLEAKDPNGFRAARMMVIPKSPSPAMNDYTRRYSGREIFAIGRMEIEIYDSMY